MERDKSSLFCVPSSFHWMKHMKDFLCCVFVHPVLVFSSWAHALLTCSTLYTPPRCKRSLSHTHTTDYSSLFSPARSLLARASQTFWWLMGWEVWRRSLPPSLPFLPSPPFLEPPSNPKHIYVWMQGHTQKQPPNASEGCLSLLECFVTRAAAVLFQAVLGKARAIWVEGLPLFGRAPALCCRRLLTECEIGGCPSNAHSLKTPLASHA